MTALWPAAAARDASEGAASEWDVVGLGECSLDQVLELEEWPAAGGKARIAAETTRPGGQIASAVLGARRLGLRAALIAAVGDDAAGSASLAPLRAAGIGLSGVQVHEDVASRSAVILVERSTGERRVLERRPAALRIDPAALDLSLVGAARCLVIDVTAPDAALVAAAEARRAGRAVVLDADAPWPSPERLLALVDFPVVPQALAEEWGRGSVERGLEFLVDRGARLAVATLGERGALARDRAALVRSPSFGCEVRDTTGAGDAFRAGFVFGLCRGWDAERVLAGANATASLNCERIGAQDGLPDRAALEQRIARGAAA